MVNSHTRHVAAGRVSASHATGFSLSCVVPACNEAPGITRFLEHLHQCVSSITPHFELVVVNDGSTDDSAARILHCADRLKIHYIELSRNFGKEFALQAGLDAADGDCVGILDADFQHPAELIRPMVDRYVRFAAVGTVAAATHFLVAVGFVSLAQWPPQIANITGYVVALAVSYLGQALWTFAQPTVSVADFARFTVASLSGFILNATAYAALLHWTRLDYRIALILVLLLVATLTFLGLSRWVFAATKHPGIS